MTRRPAIIAAGLASLCALLLAGCIDSSGPILPNAQPVLGLKLNLQLYTLRDGHALDPERARFAWTASVMCTRAAG